MLSKVYTYRRGLGVGEDACILPPPLIEQKKALYEEEIINNCFVFLFVVAMPSASSEVRRSILLLFSLDYCMSKKS